MVGEISNICRFFLRGLSDPPNGDVFQMFPGYGPHICNSQTWLQMVTIHRSWISVLHLWGSMPNWLRREPYFLSSRMLYLTSQSTKLSDVWCFLVLIIKVFGANTSAFSSRFSEFSICHPIYHENTMLLATRHAIYSAAVSTEETATFMLLPSWNNYMTTNPYASLCRKYPLMCKFLGTIPSNHFYFLLTFYRKIAKYMVFYAVHGYGQPTYLRLDCC